MLKGTSLRRRYPLLFELARIVIRPVRLAQGYAVRLRKARRFRSDFARFSLLTARDRDQRFRLSRREIVPKLDDNTGTTGFNGHYVYHTSWAARLLSRNKPEIHHDFASDIRFATLVSAFVPVVFYDYRPFQARLSGLDCRKADLVKLDLEDQSIRSLSCMHVIEHVGLGRYGDALDPRGDVKAFGELNRILARGGDLYFVAPVGRPAVKFNAHRIYSFEMVRSFFGSLELKEFSLVDDEDNFILDADPGLVARQEFGCGCFWFRKP